MSLSPDVALTQAHSCQNNIYNICN